MKNTAILAAKKAGEFIKTTYGKITNYSIKNGDVEAVVTESDIKSESIIIEEIQKKFPNHNIFSEETGQIKKDSNYTWIIDPIDGTLNYSQTIPMFCVSIAVIKDKTLILGVIYNPITEELFYAEVGKGAYLNNKKISISKTTELKKAVGNMGWGSSQESPNPGLVAFTKLSPKVKKIRILGSTALALAYVACKKIDFAIQCNIYWWDIAAGAIINKEAGALVLDLQGKPIWFTKDKISVIISNNKLRKNLLSTLGR